MNIAIVGATGNVGRKILEVLEKRNFSIDSLYLVASSKSAGSKLKFKGKEIFVHTYERCTKVCSRKKIFILATFYKNRKRQRSAMSHRSFCFL